MVVKIFCESDEVTAVILAAPDTRRYSVVTQEGVFHHDHISHFVKSCLKGKSFMGWHDRTVINSQTGDAKEVVFLSGIPLLKKAIQDKVFGVLQSGQQIKLISQDIDEVLNAPLQNLSPFFVTSTPIWTTYIEGTVDYDFTFQHCATDLAQSVVATYSIVGDQSQGIIYAFNFLTGSVVCAIKEVRCKNECIISLQIVEDEFILIQRAVLLPQRSMSLEQHCHGQNIFFCIQHTRGEKVMAYATPL